jgi:hypothetical protein
MIQKLLIIFKYALIPTYSFIFLSVYGSPEPQTVNLKIAVIWESGKPQGEVEVKHGSLEMMDIVKGKGKIHANSFAISSEGEARLEIGFREYNSKPGSEASLVHIKSGKHSFTFFLRDVSSNFPIYIPEYKVIVIPADNKSGFNELTEFIHQKHLVSKLARNEAEKEESFDSIAKLTRDQPCPVWLGLSRDIRIFQVDFARKNEAHEYDYIKPQMAASPEYLKELNNQEALYIFAIGRGQGPILKTTRRLEEGYMPILHTNLTDEDISYFTSCFTSYEKSVLNSSSLHGTNYLIADSFSYGHMFTADQRRVLKIEEESRNSKEEEETVLYFHSEALNTSSVPRYAWFKTPKPAHWSVGFSYKFNPETGFSFYNDSLVFCISRLNGRPLHDEETAILLQPGERAQFDFYLPHRPISQSRASGLSKQSLTTKLAECKKFWQSKIETAASVSLPEKRIQEMMYAGLLHLNLISYGEEPEGTLAPTIGVYSPIGTESSPIIQYYNSMGWKENARRSLQFFLDKQHEDGMIQNFGGYMVETGAALWSMGEYFRYTKDTAWLLASKDKLIKSCDFLIRWRKQNLQEEIKGKGYGMISGKVADPDDFYHQFMLNGYAYLGLKRVAEMLENIDSREASRIRETADIWKSDIREAFFNSMANSPVVPLGNGAWCPTVPPWPESTGPQALYADQSNSFSHGTFTTRDVLLGPLYLVFCEVLEPNEEASRMMLNYHSELFYQNNAVFSQPYYSRHDWLELKLGLVRSFLKTYYTTFSALADRETYNFWEHFYHVSQNKTHEEAWFLMQTRWMLFLEDKDTLRLLPGIPRTWLEDGKNIEIKNMSSYFGLFSLEVKSNLSKGYVTASISCDPKRKPSAVIIRLPHPENHKPKTVSGGVYDPKTETITISSFSGKSSVELKY